MGYQDRFQDRGFLNWSFPLFPVFGIPVRMHWFFPVLAGMYILRGLAEGSQFNAGGLLAGWYALVMTALLVTTLTHELGHCFMALRVGGHANEILLWPLGGMAFVGHGGGPRSDIKVAAAGPLTHIPMALVCAGILLLLGRAWDWMWFNPIAGWYPYGPFREAFWSNFTVAVLKIQVVLMLFNLLVPAYPLDGGRILANFLMIRHGRDRAASITSKVSIPVGVAILIWGFVQRDFLIGFIGIWVLMEAWRIHKMIQMDAVESHPMFADAPTYDYMPDRPSRPGFFARWRRRRAEARARRETLRAEEARRRVDEVLEKVSRDGIDSLTPQERHVLDEASKRGRGE